MSEFDIMVQHLEDTGLYMVTEDSRVYAELKACAAGLDLYFDMLKELEREHLIATAESDGLELYDGLLAAPHTDLSTEGRRESLLAAMSVGFNDVTLADYEKLLGIYNIHGSMSEEDGNIIIHCTDSIGSARKGMIEAHIARFAPLFSSITFE